MATKRYDNNIDYMALMQQAAAAGDYKGAAQYEQLRNEKIAGEGLNYAPTTNYAGWLDNTDYGTIGKQLMANGAPASEVLDIYNKRYDKANGTIGLQQYANDDIQRSMLEYIAGKTDGANKPQYQSEYSKYIESGFNNLNNRQPFSYDYTKDPLYQQYAESYTREGQRAMQDTLGQISARTGGLASSYAGTAAQQSYNQYMSELNDKIPDLYQLAYGIYSDEYNRALQQLQTAIDLDQMNYTRYLDEIDAQNRTQDDALDLAKLAAQQGDYSKLRELGIDTSYMEQLQKYELGQLTQPSGGGGSGSGYSGGYSGVSNNNSSGVDAIPGTTAWYQQMYDTYGEDAAAVITNSYKSLGIPNMEAAASALEGYTNWVDSKNYDSVLQKYQYQTGVGAKKLAANELKAALEQGLIDNDEYKKIAGGGVDTGYTGIYQELYNAGITNEADAADYLINQKGYEKWQVEQTLPYFMEWLADNNVGTQRSGRDAILDAANAMLMASANPQTVIDYINKNVDESNLDYVVNTLVNKNPLFANYLRENGAL